jgi:hypothetical protein
VHEFGDVVDYIDLFYFGEKPFNFAFCHIVFKKTKRKNAMAKPINETPTSRGKQGISLPEFRRTEQIIEVIF